MSQQKPINDNKVNSTSDVAEINTQNGSAEEDQGEVSSASGDSDSNLPITKERQDFPFNNPNNLISLIQSHFIESCDCNKPGRVDTPRPQRRCFPFMRTLPEETVDFEKKVKKRFHLPLPPLFVEADSTVDEPIMISDDEEPDEDQTLP